MHQNSGLDSNAAIFRNIKLHLNIHYNSSGQSGAGAVRFSKMTSSGTKFDTYEPGRGHKFENIEINGTIEGNSHYNEPVIYMDTLSKWGSGDYFSNIKLINLNIKNNSRGIYFYTGPFIDPLVFDNVISSTPVYWAPNDSQGTWNYPLININCSFPNQKTFHIFSPIDVIAIKSNTSLPKGLSTKMLTNGGATSQVNFSLPNATPGLKYSISREANFEIRIIPKEVDSIGEGREGKYLSLVEPGNSLTLECVTPGTWQVQRSAGCSTLRAVALPRCQQAAEQGEITCYLWLSLFALLASRRFTPSIDFEVDHYNRLSL